MLRGWRLGATLAVAGFAAALALSFFGGPAASRGLAPEGIGWLYVGAILVAIAGLALVAVAAVRGLHEPR